MTFNSESLILNPGNALEYITAMRNKYLAMHKAPITQGTGKDRRWTTRVPDPDKKDGRRIIRKNTKEEVEEEVIRYYMNLETHTPAVGQFVTVNDYFDRWFKYKKHDKTLKSETFRKYRNDYKRFFKDSEFGKKFVISVDFIDIENFLREQTEQHTLKRKSVTQLAGYIHGIFRLAYRERVIKEDPFDRVDLRNNVYPFCNRSMKADKDRVLTPEQIEALDEIVERHLQSNPLYLPDWAIKICEWTGLRAGEVVALEWTDIQEGELVITKSERRVIHDDGHPDTYEIGDTKNHKDRRVPVGSELQKIFMRIRQVQSENGIVSNYILANNSGRLIAPTLTKAVYRRGLEADVGTVSIHRIRRTVSSRLNQFYDRATVSHIMGHTEEVNMNHYDYDLVEVKKKQNTMDLMYAS